ncbi:MAG: hypothetical protein IGR92_16555 [Leptolyngbyaceae cyanobacterium T60_A2020_046]|nr:hypothetical protein [Leptolyngbyaceae cyanobacterium T60_A2020_046]
MLLQWLGLASTASTLLGMGTIVILRLTAIIDGLSLPVYRLPDSSPPP